VSDGPAWLVPGFSKASPSATGAGLQVPEQQGPWHKMCSQMCLGSVLRALEATWGCLVAGLDAAAIQWWLGELLPTAPHELAQRNV